jgi:hypothetical protein
MLTPAERLELLIRGGEALYGPNWQSPLARGLGINLRTVQRWVAHDAGFPSVAVLQQLVEHCRERAAVFDQTQNEIAAELDRTGNGELANPKTGSQ